MDERKYLAQTNRIQNLRKKYIIITALFLLLSCYSCIAWGACLLTVAKPFGPSGDNLDPAKGSNGWYASESGVTETLFALDFDMKLIPLLADSGSNESPLTWRIILKKNLRFHNGSILTANSVKESISRIIDEQNPSFNKRIKELLDIKHIEILGADTLVFTTNQPNAGFLYNLSSPETAIIDTSSEPGHPIGTGPFQLSTIIPNEKIVVEAFPDYWRGQAKIDKAELFVIKNPVSRMLAFESGTIDMATNFPEQDGVRLLNTGKGKIQFFPTARLCFFFVRVEDGPLKHPLVRKALNYAIDREEIIRTVLGEIGGTVAASIFPELMPWCNTELSPYQYSPEKAVKLLQEAGAGDTDGDGILEIDGKPLRLEMWTYETRASLKPTLELIKTHLAKIGIDSGIKVTKKGSPINNAMKKGEVQLNLQMWNTAPQGDPDAFIADILKTGARSNFMGYSNPDLDRLVDRAKQCFDPSQRAELYNQIQQKIYEESPVIVLFHKNMIAALSEQVHGYKINPAEKYLLTNTISKQ